MSGTNIFFRQACGRSLRLGRIIRGEGGGIRRGMLFSFLEMRRNELRGNAILNAIIKSNDHLRSSMAVKVFFHSSKRSLRYAEQSKPEFHSPLHGGFLQGRTSRDLGALVRMLQCESLKTRSNPNTDRQTDAPPTQHHSPKKPHPPHSPTFPPSPPPLHKTHTHKPKPPPFINPSQH